MNGAGQDRKAVIVISSHVARGAVGNRAAVFALETLGFTVWAAPTVILPWHPGHGRGTRIVPPGPEFAALLNELGTTPAASEVTAVMTGYFADAEQVEAAASLVKALRARNPDLLYLCDPVIGDANGLYVAEPVAQAIRDRLLPLADIATPNRFELEWLAGTALESNAAIMKAAAPLKPPRLLATSAHPMIANGTANLLVTANKALLAEHRHVEGAPSGTGDLMAALFLARLLAGESDDKALSRAAASVFEIVARSVKQGADELLLPHEASSLSHPMAMVSLRQLARPRHKAASMVQATVPLVGADGCKGGWVAALMLPGEAPQIAVFPCFADIVIAAGPQAIIAVDMPIGLPDRVGHGGRGPERLVRPLLGGRQSSVFSIPSRAAVEAESPEGLGWEEALDAHRRASAVARATSDPPRGVSIQPFFLFPKIRELDTLLRADPALVERVIESHPEVAFGQLNGGQAMSFPKKIKGRVNPAGMEERRALLERCGLPISLLRARQPAGAGEDDCLDAMACLMVAARFARGEAMSFPDPPGRDRYGLPVAIRA